MREPMPEDVRSILLKLSTGLLPEVLTEKEVKSLKEYLGDDWFYRLGYSEKLYKRPHESS